MSNIGKVFMDRSSYGYPTYAVGRTGFIYLRIGQAPIGEFIPYDSTFTGPEFFNDPVFVLIKGEDLP